MSSPKKATGKPPSAREFRQLQRELEGSKKEYRELSTKFSQAQRDLQNAQHNAESRRREYDELKGQYAGLEAAFDKLAERVIDRI